MTFLKKNIKTPAITNLSFGVLPNKTASSFVFVLPHEQIDPALDLDAGIITVSAMVSSMIFFLSIMRVQPLIFQRKYY